MVDSGESANFRVMKNTAPAASSHKLTAEQIAHFHRDGYVVIRSLIDPDTVDFAMKTIDDFITENPDKVLYEDEALKGRKPAELTVEERIFAVRGIHQQVYKDERFLKLASYPPLLSALTSVLGQDIKVLQDMALIKPPRIGSEKPPHQDAAYFEIEPHDQAVGTWWALDRATPENGCMYVWPETHRLPVVEHTKIENTFHLVLPPELLDESRKIALPMDSGDVLLFASRVFHFTPPNLSDHRRRSLQIHYASSCCRVAPGKNARTYTLVHGESKPQGI